MHAVLREPFFLHSVDKMDSVVELHGVYQLATTARRMTRTENHNIAWKTRVASLLALMEKGGKYGYGNENLKNLVVSISACAGAAAAGVRRYVVRLRCSSVYLGL